MLSMNLKKRIIGPLEQLIWVALHNYTLTFQIRCHHLNIKYICHIKNSKQFKCHTETRKTGGPTCVGGWRKIKEIRVLVCGLVIWFMNSSSHTSPSAFVSLHSTLCNKFPQRSVIISVVNVLKRGRLWVLQHLFAIHVFVYLTFTFCRLGTYNFCKPKQNETVWHFFFSSFFCRLESLQWTTGACPTAAPSAAEVRPARRRRGRVSSGVGGSGSRGVLSRHGTVAGLFCEGTSSTITKTRRRPRSW